jgi:glycosyltransferase involved in cell wall biosynthesis
MSESTFDKAPLISVVLPVYNGGQHLQQSVQSVLSQKLTNFELLIVDDCSTDGSLEYLQSLRDKRVQLFTNEQNTGLFYNLNFLIGKSKASLIKLWAQDDIMHTHCLGTFADFYNQHPNIGFIYSQRDIIDEAGNVKDLGVVDSTPAIISPDLHAGIAYFIGSITGNISSVCISRKAFDEVGLFNEQMKISADFEMWVRLARNHDTGFINDHLLQLRDHGGQLSRNESLYINHLLEDLEVYRYLDSYVPVHLKREGKKLMRHHKLVFYYTLMVKALLKGNINTAYLFYKGLSAYDNFFRMSISFLHAKMGKSIPNNYLEKFK